MVDNYNYWTRRENKIKQIESYGWKIKGEYKNLDTPTTLVCKNGHETTLRIHTWNDRSEERKSVCKECEKKEKESNILLKMGQLQLDAIAQGYSVSEAGDKSLEVVCSSGHKKVVSSTWEVKDCLQCRYDAKHEKKKDKIEALLNKTGYTITEYQKNKITYKCITCDDTYEAIALNIPNLIKRGGRKACVKCEILNSIRAAGYVLLNEYTGSNGYLKLVCPEGHLTESTIASSWNNGKRCMICHMARFGSVIQNFLDEVKAEGYTLLEEYINRRNEIPCRCPQGHEWKVSRVNWQRGIRCKYCNTGGGFNFERPGLLYYLRVYSEAGILYKIGITNNSVESRYRGEKSKFDVLMETWFDLGEDAYNEEQRILAEFQKYKYKGKNVLTCGGNTELFTKDILGLNSKM